jgi:hypothetical protein
MTNLRQRNESGHAAAAPSPRRWVRPGCWIAAALVLAAGTAIEAQTVRDSAGVQIIESRAPALGAARAWRVDPRPTLVIGDPNAATAGDSLYEFNRIMGVVRLGDGRWAVGVQGSQVIRFYDASGKLVKSAGRAGQGPGEFRQIMLLTTTRGDTLFVTDLDEVEYFTGRGEFIAQGASRRSVQGRFIWPGAVFSDRSYAGFDWNDRTIPPPGRAVRSLPLFRVSADGARIDTVAVLPAREGVFDGRQRFGAEVQFAAAGLLAGDGERIFYSFPVKPEIAELGRDGRFTRVIRLNVPPVPVTSADHDAHRTWFLALPGEDGRPASPAFQARKEQMMKEVVYSERFPAYGLLLGDRVGNLWARRYDMRERFYTPGPSSTRTIAAPTKWDVIDPRGRWLCTVELPARFTPLEVGNDYVAGVARDTDDVETVRVYRLFKP